MRTQLYSYAAKLLILSQGLLLLPVDASAQFKDQHTVEAIVAALKSPVPAQAIEDARDVDDQLMSAGHVEGGSVYLVTDERSTRVNALVRKLMQAMGEDTSRWVVRVLDTDPPMANAFVTGGKYIYVYTGLIKEAASDDELAFVLGHELGHSLLKHQYRQKEDVTTTIASLAVLAAMLSKKHGEDYIDFANIAMASYNRVDEEEADALAVGITRRAGYDPLRGADFFSRSKRQQDKAQQDTQQTLAQIRQQVQQAQATCQQWHQWFNASAARQTQENADKVNAICGDAEARRLHYNKLLEQYNVAMMEQQRDAFFRTHPQDQNRIAAIAALTDYFHNRRDLRSLSKYQQSHRVMLALQQVDSVLLKSAVAAATDPTPAAGAPAKTQASPSLADQLTQLKRAKDQGLITDTEYERKRQQILNRY